MLFKGIPEINLSPIDPLYVSELNVVQGSGPVNIKMLLKNIHFHGFSTAQVSRVVYAEYFTILIIIGF